MTTTRELPTEVAASVAYLKSMGYDDAAACLARGWFGPEPRDSESP